MFNLLEGDGVIDNIYHLLWTKDTIFGTDPFVVIPHTVLYKYQKPCYWYFTSKTDNKLKKKSTMKLNVDHIKEVFTNKISKSGIVAYYIYKKYGNKSKYETDNQNLYSSVYQTDRNTETIRDKEGSYVVEYFDVKRLNEFLSNKFSYDDGILQKFEDPKGEHNSIVRLIWSPKLCIFEKNSNLKKIYDKRFNLYERAVTYDGEEFQVRTEALKGNNIPDRIEKIGMNIASHISNITLERIKIVRMVLNFKMTKDDRIIFLWCSSLRIDNTLEKKKNEVGKYKEFDTTKIKLSVPDNINLFKFSSKGRPIKPLKDSFCINCDMNVESYKLYEISFKTLIESHENRKRDRNYFNRSANVQMTSCGVEIIPYVENKNLAIHHEKFKKKLYRNLLIPKVINAIYPKMKFEDYQILKRDDLFNAKVSYICEACYLDITRYCEISGSNRENLLKNSGNNNISLTNRVRTAHYIPSSAHSKTENYKIFDGKDSNRIKSTSDIISNQIKTTSNFDIGNFNKQNRDERSKLPLLFNEDLR